MKMFPRPQPKVQVPRAEVRLSEMGSGQWFAELTTGIWLRRSSHTHENVSGDPIRFNTREEAEAAGRAAYTEWKNKQIVNTEVVPIAEEAS